MNNEKNLGDLAERILFLTVNCKRFGNLRKSHVKLNTTANENRFSTNKKLLESPELSRIIKRDGEIKKQIASYTLPYKLGCAVLPCASSKTVKAILDAYRDVERPALVQDFVKVYVQQVADAKVALKEEFVEQNYALSNEVVNEFSFDYLMVSMNLPADMKDQAHSQIMDAASGIADALTLAAHTLVSKLADSLSSNEDGKAKKIYDSHFVKLQDFLAGFDIRNVVSNQELKAEMDKLKSLMAGIDPEKVRNNEGLRNDIAAKMSEATASLTAMVEYKGRKFRDAV